MRKTKSLKTIVFSLGLAAGMMLPASASAQGVFGDMLDNYYAEKEAQSSQGGGALLRGAAIRGVGGFAIHPQQFSDGEGGYNLYNGNFEDVTPEVPLGSGLFIMAAAGAGYALKKRKNNKKQ